MAEIKVTNSATLQLKGELTKESERGEISETDAQFTSNLPAHQSSTDSVNAESPTKRRSNQRTAKAELREPSSASAKASRSVEKGKVQNIVADLEHSAWPPSVVSTSDGSDDSPSDNTRQNNHSDSFGVHSGESNNSQSRSWEVESRSRKDSVSMSTSDGDSSSEESLYGKKTIDKYQKYFKDGNDEDSKGTKKEHIVPSSILGHTGDEQIDRTYDKYRKRLSEKKISGEKWESPSKKIGAPPALEYIYTAANKSPKREGAKKVVMPTVPENTKPKFEKVQLKSNKFGKDDLGILASMLGGDDSDEEESSVEVSISSAGDDPIFADTTQSTDQGLLHETRSADDEEPNSIGDSFELSSGIFMQSDRGEKSAEKSYATARKEYPSNGNTTENSNLLSDVSSRRYLEEEASLDENTNSTNMDTSLFSPSQSTSKGKILSQRLARLHTLKKLKAEKDSQSSSSSKAFSVASQSLRGERDVDRSNTDSNMVHSPIQEAPALLRGRSTKQEEEEKEEYDDFPAAKGQGKTAESKSKPTSHLQNNHEGAGDSMEGSMEIKLSHLKTPTTVNFVPKHETRGQRSDDRLKNSASTFGTSSSSPYERSGISALSDPSNSGQIVAEPARAIKARQYMSSDDWQSSSDSDSDDSVDFDKLTSLEAYTLQDSHTSSSASLMGIHKETPVMSNKKSPQPLRLLTKATTELNNGSSGQLPEANSAKEKVTKHGGTAAGLAGPNSNDNSKEKVTKDGGTSAGFAGPDSNDNSTGLVTSEPSLHISELDKKSDTSIHLTNHGEESEASMRFSDQGGTPEASIHLSEREESEASIHLSGKQGEGSEASIHLSKQEEQSEASIHLSGVGQQPIERKSVESTEESDSGGSLSLTAATNNYKSEGRTDFYRPVGRKGTLMSLGDKNTDEERPKKEVPPGGRKGSLMGLMNSGDSSGSFNRFPSGKPPPRPPSAPDPSTFDDSGDSFSLTEATNNDKSEVETQNDRPVSRKGIPMSQGDKNTDEERPKKEVPPGGRKGSLMALMNSGDSSGSFNRFPFGKPPPRPPLAPDPSSFEDEGSISEFSLKPDDNLDSTHSSSKLTKLKRESKREMSMLESMNQGFQMLDTSELVDLEASNGENPDPVPDCESRDKQPSTKVKRDSVFATGLVRHTMRAWVALLILATIGLPIYLLLFLDSDNDGHDRIASLNLFPNAPFFSPAPSPSLAPSTPAPTIQPTLAPFPPTLVTQPTPIPLSPTLAPDLNATLLPTCGQSCQLEELLIAAWPSLAGSLTDRSTPQNRAFTWLLDDPALNEYEDFRLIQRFALASLYYSTSGDQWRRRDSWLSGENECSWYSGSVDPPCDDDGFYVRLDLDLNDLSGTLPSEVALLSNLVAVGVSKSGSSSSLRGTIPSEVGLLDKLIAFNIRGNDMVGHIPDSLGNCTNMQVLDLSRNSLSFSIPSTVGAMVQLGTLDLSGNQLFGLIPSEIGQLTNLERLNLQRNIISGEVPTTIGNMSLLRTLDIHGNRLSRLPDEIGNLGLLRQLIAHDNRLIGSIPTTVGGLVELLSIQLQNNFLTGILPTEIGNMLELRDVFDLSNNDLGGTIPSEFGELVLLRALVLNNNQFNGTIPEAFSSLTQLEVLRLEANNLTGEVPDVVCASYNESVPIFAADCSAPEIICPCCMYCCEDLGDCSCQFAGTSLEFFCDDDFRRTRRSVVF